MGFQARRIDKGGAMISGIDWKRIRLANQKEAGFQVETCL
jgi:hypothetical protein